MIVTIVSSEIKQGAKGDYLYIKYIDHKDNSEHAKAIFNTLKAKWGLISYGAILELKQDAKYNVTDIIPGSENLKEPVKPEPAPLDKDTQEEIKKAYEEATQKTSQSKSTSDKMSKDDWDEKDKRTRKSIERQKALELSVNYSPDNYTLEDMIKSAKRFEKYLEIGD